MYKRTSDNSQSRTDRHALHGTHNGAGIDPTVFNGSTEPDAENERARLVMDKAQVEAKLSQVNAQLRTATGDPRSDFKAKCEAQRASLVRRLGGINGRLTAMNFERGVRSSEERTAADDFPKMFMTLAREMLAEPIYNRIVVASHHRQQEQKERR